MTGMTGGNGAALKSPVLILVNRPVLAESGRDHTGEPDASAFVRADPRAPHLRLNDLGVLRGDGVFESIGVSHGSPLSLEEHLERLARSAGLLDLPAPDLDIWRHAVLAGVAAHESLAELAVRLVMTRGVAGWPSAWVWVEPAEDFGSARTDGVSVITLDRGVRHDAVAHSPWLLLGAKSLSYAVNQAALREAARRGADDVIFLSSDGYVLEGPTSSVILRHGDIVTTPGTDAGVLPGTTQARAFAFFAERGIRSGYEQIPQSALATADAVWLVSSIRQAAPVRELDGRETGTDPSLTGALNDALLGLS